MRVQNLLTLNGSLTYSLHKKGKVVVADIGGTFDAPNHRLVLVSPLLKRPKSVVLDGKHTQFPKMGEIRIKSLPIHVELTY